ncbi:spermidine putrescine-binding periplasmic protein [Lactobacillus selangorensis]|uniref:Spermidine putrescine-binding periplasmic protein n=1 Tax=Lactobacillus selangorensis TaxID=81857 RepID=A0A0R2FPI4_9LACO|nr:ABC transporter substrate-binding protein [Lactobacillus selangorensis]KRN27673.1 spermidine putrescine-binding periplasmic protein [Lactobacillus selangorensis]KRN30360.1 spermidine putrescine-binding periplasmic protein [Lactobacillus selangorensis]
MKKLVAAITTILVFCGLLAFTSDRLAKSQVKSQSNTLTLYNWGDYIDPALLKKFQKETGYHVSVETFDSNEAMYTKIKQGGTSYDLAVPSDYMIQKMKAAHLLVPLDKSKLHGMNNISPQFRNLEFDRHNQYSVPYFWGTLGIIYNDKTVKASQVQHWKQLWNPRFKDSIMLVDSARDVMGFALIRDGDSVNTKNIKQLNAAKKRLDSLTPNVKAIVADEIKMYMIENEAPIAVDWSGEASEMLSQNSHLHYVVPSEGSNLWFDNLVIPKTAKHYKAIYAFLNFMLKPENAAQNAEYVGYATPNEQAKALLPASVRNDKQFYPDAETMKHLQIYNNLSPELIGTYNELYLEFKMYRN